MKRINLELDNYVAGFFEISFGVACLAFLFVCIDLILKDWDIIDKKKGKQIAKMSVAANSYEEFLGKNFPEMEYQVIKTPAQF